MTASNCECCNKKAGKVYSPACSFLCFKAWLFWSAVAGEKKLSRPSVVATPVVITYQATPPKRTVRPRSSSSRFAHRAHRS